MDKFCDRHTNTKMIIGECRRCDGNGYTESDIEEMYEPLAWHSDGRCYMCRGTGKGFLECPICEEEFRMQNEMEDEE